jgi:hypothetical protein
MVGEEGQKTAAKTIHPGKIKLNTMYKKDTH